MRQRQRVQEGSQSLGQVQRILLSMCAGTITRIFFSWYPFVFPLITQPHYLTSSSSSVTDWVPPSPSHSPHYFVTAHSFSHTFSTFLLQTSHGRILKLVLKESISETQHAKGRRWIMLYLMFSVTLTLCCYHHSSNLHFFAYFKQCIIYLISIYY